MSAIKLLAEGLGIGVVSILAPGLFLWLAELRKRRATIRGERDDSNLP